VHSEDMTVRVAVLLGVFVCGYLRWALAGLILASGWLLYTGNNRKEKEQADKDRIAERLWKDPAKLEKFLMGTFPATPKWIRHPWYDRAPFINDFLRVAWPHVNKGMGKLLKYKLQPVVKRRKPGYLSQLEIKTVNFGNTPPHVEGIKFFRHRDNSAVVDVHCMFVADEKQNISVTIGTVGFSAVALLENLRMRFTLRLTFKRLNEHLPLFEQLAIHFAERPDVQFTLSGANVKLTSIPGLKTWLLDFVSDKLCGKIVWPRERVLYTPNTEKIARKVGIPWPPPGWDPLKHYLPNSYWGEKGLPVPGDPQKNHSQPRPSPTSPSKRTKNEVAVEGKERKFARLPPNETDVEPQGLLDVVLMEASGLCGNLNSEEIAKRKPSPYVVFTVGTDCKVSTKQKNTTSPVWRERFEMVVYSATLQKLHIAVKDSRKRGSLGVIGEVYINLNEARRHKGQRHYRVDLLGSGGKISFLLEWNPFRKNTDECEEDDFYDDLVGRPLGESNVKPGRGKVKITELLSPTSERNDAPLPKEQGFSTHNNNIRRRVFSPNQTRSSRGSHVGNHKRSASADKYQNTPGKGRSEKIQSDELKSKRGAKLGGVSSAAVVDEYFGVENSSQSNGKVISKESHCEEYSHGHSGIIHVTLVCGEHLDKTFAKHNHIDPYVVFTLGKHKKKSSIKWKEFSPVWGETYEMPVMDDRREILDVKVFDKERFRVDAGDGHVRIPIQQIMTLAGGESPYRLNRKWKLSKKGGFVELDLKYYQKQIRNSDCDAAGGVEKSSSDTLSKPKGEQTHASEVEIYTDTKLAALSSQTGMDGLVGEQESETDGKKQKKFLKWTTKLLNWGKQGRSKYDKRTTTPPPSAMGKERTDVRKTDARRNSTSSTRKSRRHPHERSPSPPSEYQHAVSSNGSLNDQKPAPSTAPPNPPQRRNEGQTLLRQEKQTLESKKAKQEFDDDAPSQNLME